jgi:competence protein ComEC
VPHAFAWPAAALIAGITSGIALTVPPHVAASALVLALGAAVRAYRVRDDRRVLLLVLAGWLAAGAALGSRAERLAQAPPLRAAALGDPGVRSPAPASSAPLDPRGGPSADRLHVTAAATASHSRSRRRAQDRDQVVTLTGRLRQDAALLPQGVGLTMEVDELASGSPALRVEGGVMLTVLGRMAAPRIPEWREGRRLRVQAVVREPTRYLDPGVPDLPLSLARRGTAVVGSVKSGALVEVLQRGSWLEEHAASARHRIRQLTAASVGSRDPRTAAIVTAILIGDRAGLDDRIERDLQEAGTYHVIAISGGNIAILTACLLLTWRLLLVPWRAGLSLTILVLVAYAELAGGGSSVSRATTMAVVYLGALLLDQRTSAASALAVAASLILVANPLALVDPGFVLTFGATIAIVAGVPAFTSLVAAPPVLRPPLALLAASAAAELALLPLGPFFFSRVTLAGLLFNFAAVPLMSIVQIGGMAAVAITAAVPSVAHAAGWVPHQAALGLISSAALVHHVPWLTWRVPAPSLLIVALYYSGLVALVSARVWVRWTVPWHRAARRVAVLVTGAGALLILGAPLPRWPSSAQLRSVVLDVGQGDATFVRFPSGRTLLVDAGGLGGTARFDIGERVVAPALWHFAVRRLDVLAVTHGDADHAGGAGAALDIFRPREVWDGVPVPRDAGLTDLAARADARRIPWRTLQAGDVLRDGAVTVRAWHPPPPDWERQRVRNDDSLVLEIRYGDVSVVLPGDIGREVEEGLARVIPAAGIRVLKVPHHGSATSSSMRFLTALRPQLAIVSCGRGNHFGHPSPAVLARYREVGAAVYRTDQQGAITIDTDGQTVNVTPFVRPASRWAP